jgi:transketolase
MKKPAAPAPYPRGTRHDPEMVADLARGAVAFRLTVLEMVYSRQTGHIGGAFSIAEILTALYFHQLRIDPANPLWEERDLLLLSKGHACAMLYAVLAQRGFFPVAELAGFRSLGSRLQGHPERGLVPGVEIPAGPLGHGIAVGAGLALAARMRGSRKTVFVILGDGEINAGVIWEGALVAAKYRLDNLVAVVDYNGVQQTGTTDRVLPTEPIAEKWRSFGWHVLETHGHNMARVLDTLDEAEELHGKPVAIVARTTKGKGVSFMEYDPYWHGSAPNAEQYAAARRELEEDLERWQRS